MDPMKNEEARVSEQEQIHNMNGNGKPRKRGHCGRFWWAYVLAVIIIIVVVVPVV